MRACMPAACSLHWHMQGERTRTLGYDNWLAAGKKPGPMKSFIHYGWAQGAGCQTRGLPVQRWSWAGGCCGSPAGAAAAGVHGCLMARRPRRHATVPAAFALQLPWLHRASTCTTPPRWPPPAPPAGVQTQTLPACPACPPACPPCRFAGSQGKYVRGAAERTYQVYAWVHERCRCARIREDANERSQKSGRKAVSWRVHELRSCAVPARCGFDSRWGAALVWAKLQICLAVLRRTPRALCPSSLRSCRQRMTEGGLDMPAPILSNLFSSLQKGLEAFEHCR